jgi:putative Mg2+ transporter-C (MgtC) family protein
MGPSDFPVLLWPTAHVLIVSIARLGVAALFGGLIGYQRERVHSSAGLRTHMLVSVGAAIFVLTAVESGWPATDVSRIIQGIVSGIGFLGAGAILKMSDRAEVRGLTTAASIWIAAAVGIATGLGHVWLPIVGSVFAWLILGPFAHFENRQLPPPKPPEGT